MLARGVVVLVLAVAVPYAVSQLLPPNYEPRSPVIPLVVLAALGALAGLTWPRLRAWMALSIWVVVAAVLVLASWTDLLLDVAPSVVPVDAWRDAAFLGIASAVAVTSAGFAAGALVQRRGSLGKVSRGAAIAVSGVLVLCLVLAGGTAAAFSRTPIVVQDDASLLTVVITDTGLEVTPPAMGGTEYRVVYESRATVPRVITRVVPLRVADGLPRALTADEIETWLAGDWTALAPPFAGAAMSSPIEPGERRYVGLLGVDPSTDGTGGTLVYASGPDAFRPWPAMAGDGGYENVAWPIDAHVVIPLEGDWPGATIALALDRLQANDLDGLRSLACAGQEDRIRDQLGLPGTMGGSLDLLPGVDTEALIDAVRLDVSGVKLGDATLDGDTAQVPVTGTLKVTFDATAMRPILRQVLGQQGTTMTDEQLDALLKTLEAYGQDVPIEQSVRLVREDGAWKICQDSVNIPAGS